MMAKSYMVGIVLVYVETFCIIFLIKCKELAGLWACVQNRNNKYMNKNHTIGLDWHNDEHTRS